MRYLNDVVVLDPYRQIWQANYARLDNLLAELKTESEKNK